jgi:lysozyme
VRFEVVDRCPVPVKAAPAVLEGKRRSGQLLNSCFRGKEARAILHQLGKMDQDQLWEGFRRGLPGFNPANPPGFSTHECFNDGPAFPQFRRGARIPDEFVGQDWTNAWKVVQAYRAMGVNAALTYPNSVREKQHVNIRAIPKNIHPPLEIGDGRHGGGGIRKRVERMTYRLSYIATPHSGGKGRYLDGRRERFDAETEKALKHFQRDHGLTPDGIYGPMSEHQLDLAYAHWKKRRAEQHPKPPHHIPAPKPPKPSKPRGPVKRSAYPGIDVSNNNGDIDWKAVAKAGKLFAYLRATEGLSGHGSEDEFFTSGRLRAMRHAGVIPGYYHFAHPQPRRDPRAEARHFFHYVDGAGGWDQPVFFPPMLDAEWANALGTDQLQSWYERFLVELERLLRGKISRKRARQIKAVTGMDPRRPGVYTGLWFWGPHIGHLRLGQARFFATYPLWLSYYTQPPKIPTLPRPWRRKGLFMLQHWDKGSVPGVPGGCDLNIMYGHIDTKRLRALL